MAITLAFVGTVVSETVGANAGLGYLIALAGSNFQMPLVFAALLLLAVEGIAMYAVFAYVEQLFHALGLPLLDERCGLSVRCRCISCSMANCAPKQGIPPSITVLDYLRGHARLTGTKEGCAEGDCGACTIVVARPRDGKMQYEAVNSCLMLLPQLDGASVLTVEGLASNGELHPVQQALVETDGTQCGFCTPGFVMALLRLPAGRRAGRDRAHPRCAGRQPVPLHRLPARSSPRRMPAAAAKPRVRSGPRCAEQRRLSLRRARRVWMPRSLDELVALRAEHPDALLLAGGTDLGLAAARTASSFRRLILTGACRTCAASL